MDDQKGISNILLMLLMLGLGIAVGWSVNFVVNRGNTEVVIRQSPAYSPPLVSGLPVQSPDLSPAATSTGSPSPVFELSSSKLMDLPAGTFLNSEQIDCAIESDINQALCQVHQGKKVFVVHIKENAVSADPKELYDAAAGLAVGPDGQRYAYSAKSGGQWSVVIDGRETDAHDEVGGLTFSPDGRHLAYWARDGQRSFIIIDGRAEEPHDAVSALGYSPDGGKFVYRAKDNGKYFYVLDGKELERFDSVDYFTFSPDGQRYAYAAEQDGKWQVIADGRESESFDEILNLGFGPYGSHLVFQARQDKDWFIILDGEKSEPFDTIGYFTFSPDGQRYAYTASRTVPAEGGSLEKNFIVLDGKKTQHTYVSIYDLVFSADGEQFAYAAGKVENNISKQYVVLNGQASNDWEGEYVSGLSFSPAGGHIAYFAMEKGKWYLIIDGQKSGTSFADQPYFLAFSLNGQHNAFEAAEAGKLYVVLDGKMSDPYVDVEGFADGDPFTSDSRFLVYYAQKGSELWRIVAPLASE